jgi:hypothetical protein
MVQKRCCQKAERQTGDLDSVRLGLTVRRVLRRATLVLLISANVHVRDCLRS